MLYTSLFYIGFVRFTRAVRPILRDFSRDEGPAILFAGSSYEALLHEYLILHVTLNLKQLVGCDVSPEFLELCEKSTSELKCSLMPLLNRLRRDALSMPWIEGRAGNDEDIKFAAKYYPELKAFIVAMRGISDRIQAIEKTEFNGNPPQWRTTGWKPVIKVPSVKDAPNISEFFW